MAARARSGSTGVLVEYSTSRPPVNSTPKLSPRITMPERASTTAIAETASQRRPCRIRSGFRAVSQLRTRPRFAIPLTRGRCRTARLFITHSASTRVMTRALIREASTPMDSVTPNPRTGPDARKKSSPAASKVVTFESAIALSALRKPAVSAARRLLLPRAAYSSRARSNTRTLASTAMPIASTKPARPGRVKVAPRATRAA